jgi:hypothetical protein
VSLGLKRANLLRTHGGEERRDDERALLHLGGGKRYSKEGWEDWLVRDKGGKKKKKTRRLRNTTRFI